MGHERITEITMPKPTISVLHSAIDTFEKIKAMEAREETFAKQIDDGDFDNCFSPETRASLQKSRAARARRQPKKG